MAKSDRTDEQPEPKLLRVSEVAKMLRVSRHTVYRMIHEGDLPHRLINGRMYRVPVSAVKTQLGEDD
jgi:excisionase family DNA binding protein